ncbi:hypothetical protein MSAN_00085400 [Mycena sanguinolenta]|uniref:F-box domain-containing protein n=1 Tax=Mycena sanguinolenta TaxID=230812 RepID=A0A8H6ZG07_9AGAR|nr:hypothetical protein MSAN_00085400 [Mycena sanguinolenta]
MSSPFASKLGTNYCPLDVEIPEIQAVLVEPLSRLRSLDDRIADLQKAIDELAQERAGVKTYVDAHQALLSPIRRLPLDILQEIFVACLPTHRNCVMSASEAPVLLGRICSSWRALALSSPRLWSSVHIVEPDRAHWPAELQAQRVEITKAWLGRSGQCPLAISLFGDARPDPASTEHRSASVLETLIPFASRWHNISLTSTSSGLNSLSCITENDVPMLTTLEISEIYRSAESPGTRWESFGLLHAPNISSFTFISGNSHPLTLPLQWDRLLSLSLDSSSAFAVTSEMAVEIFSRCPRLQTCRLKVNDEVQSAVEESQGTILGFPHLQSLKIISVGIPINTVGGLFSRVSLPELQHLTLLGHLGREADGEFAFFPFLTTLPRLQSLSTDSQLYDDQALTGLLHALPATLRQFQVICRDSWRHVIDDDALLALTPSPDRPFKCPVLEELKITYSCSLSDEALLKFILARMTIQPVTLRSVEIHFPRQMELDLRPDIQSFLDGGLKVDARYRSPPLPRLSPWVGLKEDYKA